MTHGVDRTEFATNSAIGNAVPHYLLAGWLVPSLHARWGHTIDTMMEVRLMCIATATLQDNHSDQASHFHDVPVGHPVSHG